MSQLKWHKTCAQCGKEYLGRSTQKYCGYSCSQKAAVNTRRQARQNLYYTEEDEEENQNDP